jgi:hypothetical protein
MQALFYVLLRYVRRVVTFKKMIFVFEFFSVSNWMSELQLWAPQLRCVKYYGTFKDRREALVRFPALI